MACCIHQDTYGQFGKIKNALKKGSTNTSVQIDWDSQKTLPAVSLSSFLSNDGLRLELDGTLKIEALEISFLPKKDKNGTPINYDPYKRADFLITADLNKQGGDEKLHTYYFTVNPVSQPFSLMSAIHRPNDDMHQHTQITEGDYILEFHVADKHVQSITFSVVKATNDDTYAAMNEMYFLDGPWNKYGRLSFTENVGKEQLVFEFYILNNTTDIENEHRPNKQKEMSYTFQLFRNGNVVAANYVNSDGSIKTSIAQGARGYWNITGVPCMKYPAKKDRRGAIQEYFTKSDMIDGNYKIVLEQEQFTGGSISKTYNFTVSNQRIVPIAQADRKSYYDITTLIEQGPEFHFIKLTK